MSSLDSILDTLPLGAFSIDASGQVRDWNRSMRHWTGIAAEDAVGQHLDDVFPDALETKHWARIRLVLGGGPPTVFSSHLHGCLFPLVLRNGQSRKHHTTVSGLRRDDGATDAVFVLQDVSALSEQIDALREAKRLRDQIEQAQRLESLGLLAGGIAHDFNNVLASLLLSADMARHSLDDPDEAAEHLEEVLTAGRRGADLARQMLAYAGKAKVEDEDMDVGALIEDTTKLLRASVSKHIGIELGIDSAPAWCRASPTQLQQVVMNLVINAAEAIGEVPGTISLSTSVTDREAVDNDSGLAVPVGAGDDFVCLEVCDDGPGIGDPETTRRLFDPFFSTKSTGRGLGLAAVQGIVTRYGGGVSVCSWPGRGTRFRIYLPRVQAPTETGGTVAKVGRPAAPLLGTVLLVDDEEPVRRSTRSAIERMGLRVVEACDGLDGIRKFEEHRHEIVAAVIDYVMPGANGMEVLTRIRDAAPELPALFVSGYGEMDASRWPHAVTAVLPKPYDLDTLRERLGHLLVQSDVHQDAAAIR